MANNTLYSGLAIGGPVDGKMVTSHIPIYHCNYTMHLNPLVQTQVLPSNFRATTFIYKFHNMIEGFGVFVCKEPEPFLHDDFFTHKNVLKLILSNYKHLATATENNLMLHRLTTLLEAEPTVEEIKELTFHLQFMRKVKKGKEVK